MRFFHRKKKQTPTVIIIALIDVLIVLLIFMMVTTTVKNQPAVRLALPEARQAAEGAAGDNLIVTIEPEAPHLYIGALPVTFDRLQAELAAAVAKNPKLSVTLNADTQVPWGQIVRIMDASKAAGIQSVNARIRQTP
jgi:biopolymer transport protein ExbD